MAKATSPPASTVTPHRAVRVDDELWARFDKAAAAHGGRSSVMRRLMRLYLRDTGTRHVVYAMTDPTRENNPGTAARTSH